MKTMLLILLVFLFLSESNFAYGNSTDQYYRSTDGSEVHGPTHGYDSHNGKETAVCNDGTVSYSHHHRGTCSHHGGVEEWEDQ